ncbi:hypothetical protein [Streptomyces anulatus]|uniref:hypothetical protein n=1 Tax=Streptomyces anulatus TaxID=1892 RepID=UPI0033FC5D77
MDRFLEDRFLVLAIAELRLRGGHDGGSSRVRQVTRTYDISLEPVTEQLIDLVLADQAAPRAGRS